MCPQASHSDSTRNADEQEFAKVLDMLPDGLANLESECRQNPTAIQSELAVRLTEAQYAALTDIAPDAIISTDEAGRIVMFNKRHLDNSEAAD